MCLLRAGFLGVLIAVVLRPPVHAQSFDIRHQRDLSSNPGDLHFRLATADGVTTFHRGERIPLTLEFWSDSPDKYKLNGATYDRGGRLPTEEFVLDRNDVVDPYADYFSTGVLGGLAGGLRTYPVLDAKPYKIEVNLNDWFRFDQPGTYRLYLKSHRLSRESNPGETGDRVIQFAAVSNVLELEIVADDAAWTESKLWAIESVLTQPEPEMPKPGGPPVPVNPLEGQLRSARQELRYLGTPAALALAFQDARKLGTSPDTLLLIGAREREQTVSAYDRYLADQSTPIREWDIRLRALFTFVQREAPKALPTYPWQIPAGSDMQKIWAEGKARQKRFAELVRAQAIRLIPVASAKDETARKISGEAIAAIAPTEAKAAYLVPPDDYGLSRDELIAQFPTFPVDQQAELLGKKWDLVRSPDMIAALRAVISRVEPTSLPKTALALQVWGAQDGIGEMALRRLKELSPQEAYRIVAKDLASGKPRFAAFAARKIDAQDIPEADGIFARWLAAGELGALPLIAKFGSAKLAGDMRKRYLAESWPCAEEASFITYFVRTLPPSGSGSASELLKHALADREGRGCHHFLLNQVGQVVWNPVLENQAILSLDDPDPETAVSAVQALSAHGSAAVEPFLWKRLEQWNERWRGRTSEFEVHPISGDVPDPARGLGPALFRGIASAKSWIVDEPRRRRLSELCLDEPCRKEWAQPRPPSTLIIDVSNGGGGYPAAFRVDGYQAPTFDGLKEKLFQYPQGTVFRWCPQAFNPFDTFSPGQREEMYQQIKPLLAARSMTIAPYSEEKCFGASN
ncbi:MAG TPA: hypothetical protein VMH80_00760 [Bryobacteraceae bacterium]|nr:hypothetical protein [Bryobacteraceae bacterium]